MHKQTSGYATGLVRTSDRPRIYTASKLDMAMTWRKLKSEQERRIDFHARWPVEFYGQLEDTADNARMFWIADLQDVALSDGVLCYADPYFRRPLRGALIEAGAAMALGKPVFIVGESPCYGTWQQHPLVIKCQTIAHACDEIVHRWEPIVRKFRMHD